MIRLAANLIIHQPFLGRCRENPLLIQSLATRRIDPTTLRFDMNLYARRSYFFDHGALSKQLLLPSLVLLIHILIVRYNQFTLHEIRTINFNWLDGCGSRRIKVALNEGAAIIVVV